MHTQTKRAQHRLYKTVALGILSVLLSLALILASFALYATGGAPLERAHAVTSAEKEAEVDAALARLDELQTELNQIEIDYQNAVAERALAEERMLEAQAREEAAKIRIAELQEQLSVVAVDTYQQGPGSFLDVLFGAQSFDEFVTALDMANRVSTHNAGLVEESKLVRAEAEAARLEYEAQMQIAAEREAEMAELKTQKEVAVSSLQAEIEALQAEAAELLAQEELAAEAARVAAGQAENIDPALVDGVGSLVHPCPGYRISSGFGYRSLGYGSTYHLGTDFAGPYGGSIYAAQSGTVTAVGYAGAMGNRVIINHGSGVRTIYAHCSSFNVSAGQSVSAGQVIAFIGSTGVSSGPHLHFQIEISGTALDPMLFL